MPKSGPSLNDESGDESGEEQSVNQQGQEHHSSLGSKGVSVSGSVDTGPSTTTSGINHDHSKSELEQQTIKLNVTDQCIDTILEQPLLCQSAQIEYPKQRLDAIARLNNSDNLGDSLKLLCKDMFGYSYPGSFFGSNVVQPESEHALQTLERIMTALGYNSPFEDSLVFVLQLIRSRESLSLPEAQQQQELSEQQSYGSNHEQEQSKKSIHLDEPSDDDAIEKTSNEQQHNSDQDLLTGEMEIVTSTYDVREAPEFPSENSHNFHYAKAVFLFEDDNTNIDTGLQYIQQAVAHGHPAAVMAVLQEPTLIYYLADPGEQGEVEGLNKDELYCHEKVVPLLQTGLYLIDLHTRAMEQKLTETEANILMAQVNEQISQSVTTHKDQLKAIKTQMAYDFWTKPYLNAIKAQLTEVVTKVYAQNIFLRLDALSRMSLDDNDLSLISDIIDWCQTVNKKNVQPKLADLSLWLEDINSKPLRKIVDSLISDLQDPSQQEHLLDLLLHQQQQYHVLLPLFDGHRQLIRDDEHFKQFLLARLAQDPGDLYLSNNTQAIPFNSYPEAKPTLTIALTDKQKSELLVETQAKQYHDNLSIEANLVASNSFKDKCILLHLYERGYELIHNNEAGQCEAVQTIKPQLEKALALVEELLEQASAQSAEESIQHNLAAVRVRILFILIKDRVNHCDKVTDAKESANYFINDQNKASFEGHPYLPAQVSYLYGIYWHDNNNIEQSLLHFMQAYKLGHPNALLKAIELGVIKLEDPDVPVKAIELGVIKLEKSVASGQSSQITIIDMIWKQCMEMLLIRSNLNHRDVPPYYSEEMQSSLQLDIAMQGWHVDYSDGGLSQIHELLNMVKEENPFIQHICLAMGDHVGKNKGTYEQFNTIISEVLAAASTETIDKQSLRSTSTSLKDSIKFAKMFDDKERLLALEGMRKSLINNKNPELAVMYAEQAKRFLDIVGENRLMRLPATPFQAMFVNASKALPIPVIQELKFELDPRHTNYQLLLSNHLGSKYPKPRDHLDEPQDEVEYHLQRLAFARNISDMIIYGLTLYKGFSYSQYQHMPIIGWANPKDKQAKPDYSLAAMCFDRALQVVEQIANKSLNEQHNNLTQYLNAMSALCGQKMQGVNKQLENIGTLINNIGGYFEEEFNSPLANVMEEESEQQEPTSVLDYLTKLTINEDALQQAKQRGKAFIYFQLAQYCFAVNKYIGSKSVKFKIQHKALSYQLTEHTEFFLRLADFYEHPYAQAYLIECGFLPSDGLDAFQAYQDISVRIQRCQQQQQPQQIFYMALQAYSTGELEKQAHNARQNLKELICSNPFIKLYIQQAYWRAWAKTADMEQSDYLYDDKVGIVTAFAKIIVPELEKLKGFDDNVLRENGRKRMEIKQKINSWQSSRSSSDASADILKQISKCLFDSNGLVTLMHQYRVYRYMLKHDLFDQLGLLEQELFVDKPRKKACTVKEFKIGALLLKLDAAMNNDDISEERSKTGESGLQDTRAVEQDSPVLEEVEYSEPGEGDKGTSQFESVDDEQQDSNQNKRFAALEDYVKQSKVFLDDLNITLEIPVNQSTVEQRLQTWKPSTEKAVGNSAKPRLSSVGNVVSKVIPQQRLHGIMFYNQSQPTGANTSLTHLKEALQQTQNHGELCKVNIWNYKTAHENYPESLLVASLLHYAEKLEQQAQHQPELR